MLPHTEEGVDGTDPDLDPLEAIYDALDGGDAATALALARQAAQTGGADDPVLRFLAGMALLELDRPGEAADELGRAVQLDPEDAEFRANHARALFLGCRFEPAAAEAARALELDPKLPDAHDVQASLLERSGRWAEADRHLERAARLDPERFGLPLRLGADAFAAQVTRAAEHLPERFRALLDRVAVSVEPVPPEAVLLDAEPALDPELLGLFVGTPRTEAGAGEASGELPARIYLFQRNLERYAADGGDLAEQIAITLYHELGHYLGLEEDQLEALDFG
ncbi:MAG TPA: metallopeptidase family protein [Candidatus Polarisedimenticolaceae bacterium]|nr:metallopeptidase family protein [Candidatus Polarisedimenticolaceae bacterium]